MSLGDSGGACLQKALDLNLASLHRTRLVTICYSPMTTSPQPPVDPVSLSQLVEIMATLRSDKGCPWDRAQTHKSITRYLIEETYEVVTAIEDEDFPSLKEELGDLLLHVVFHAQMAREAGTFAIDDVLQAICTKLIERHPHVFGDAAKLASPEEVERNWNLGKTKRKGGQSLMAGIPQHLPALLKAVRVEERAASVGFTWRKPQEAMAKIKEEYQEVEDALAAGDKEAVKAELGDLLLSTANLARMLDINPEEALNRSTATFVERFGKVEAAVAKAGKSLGDLELPALEVLWEEAKQV